ncbi:ABC transporter ATP-binding protein [Lacrimispora sp. 210928-DFI.3.58]|uniref:ABC transporter ATP-binding protein n=1 Tax=Lacrimispora sp. 210928-DFI.3.58 TaxID=2883214 RepID=UPI001D08AA91|nr:ABC transporter ATP-binding protein [Lacrimispora sp. 210928-DFI.3.58]MCB7317578.1 ABC transporter ATP-binding protein [Lacrimispora sp. 210928-DFI.3.58]
MEKLVEVKNLKKYFKTPKGILHAVDDVSLDIEKGKTLGVVGESGCGKSTLGRTILGLLKATSGEVIFDGKNVTNLEGEDYIRSRQNMQIIFQDPFSSLNPRMTVREAIEEGLIVHGICKNWEERASRVRDLMDTVGLAKRLENSYPHELDGGRRQRIGIARALALDPKFIVCDEPVSALDVSIQAQILNLMQDLQEEKGLTYLFITHNLSVVRHISDNIMVMYLGERIEMCESEELFLHTLHPYTKALLAAIPSTDIDRKQERQLIQGEITSPIDPKPGCRFAPRCPYAAERCRCETPEAREILPKHYVACHYVEEINQLTAR